MNLNVLEALRDEWQRRKDAFTDFRPPTNASITSAEPDLSDLEEFLSRCTEAGREIADAGERSDLRRLVREVAETVFQYSDDYPEVAIAPARSVRPFEVSIARLPVTGEFFSDRDEEVKKLEYAWGNSRINVVVIVAWGGVGKSALVNRFLARMAKDDWRGALRVFGWTFSSPGVEGIGGAVNEFFRSAFAWFGGDERDAALEPLERGQRLADLVRNARTLLVLDASEQLQLPSGELGDVAVQAFLRQLAAANEGLCIITTRNPIRELASFQDSTLLEIKLENLSDEAAVELLRRLDVRGLSEDLQQAGREAHGHALTLNLLGRYLRDICSGDIGRRDEVDLIGIGQRGREHAEGVMATYERQLGDVQLDMLFLLGLFTDRARPKELDVLRADPPIADLTDAIVPLSREEWERNVASLRRMGLVAEASEDEPNALDVAHLLVRAYFAKRLREKLPFAWRDGHQRLFEYYRGSERLKPTTQEGMDPLFKAVFHGCHAGQHAEAFADVLQRRILQWDEETHRRFYSTNTLGLWGETLGAIRPFFSRPWADVREGFSERQRAFLFTSAGTCLRALYRFDEAIDATTRGFQVHLRNEEWNEAAFALRMLNQTHIAAGNLAEAGACGKLSVELAERGAGEAEACAKLSVELADKERMKLVHRVCAYARYGESLHHQARTEKELEWAKQQFEHARDLWRKTAAVEVDPLVDGFSEYEYCDLLVTISERSNRETAERNRETARARAGLVHDSAAKADEQGNSQYLWHGLSHLMFGKIAFLEAGALAEVAPERRQRLEQAQEHFRKAVERLKRADEQQHVPLGYLAQANLYCEMGKLDEASRVLTNVKEVASLSGMRLHLTDFHLASARLALKLRDERAAADHMEKANNLIQATGYHRRDEELKKLRLELKKLQESAGTANGR